MKDSSAERVPPANGQEISPAHQEAKALAREIAQRDRLNEDAVFADAMHVAVALALETEERPYTKRNVSWMFERITPEEVREVLLLRSVAPEDYDMLPQAGTIEDVRDEDLAAALSVASSLTREEIDAFFFSDEVGRA